MSYSLQCEESVWHRSEFTVDDDEESSFVVSHTAGSGRNIEAVECVQDYYWIESTEREDVLAVPDFPTGEETLVKLEEEDLTFEEFVEQDEDGCKIVERKQKVYGVFH